MRSTSSTLVS